MRKGRQSPYDLRRGFLHPPFCVGSGAGRNPGKVHSGSWDSKRRPGCGDTGSEPPVWIHTLPGSPSPSNYSRLLPSHLPGPGLATGRSTSELWAGKGCGRARDEECAGRRRPLGPRLGIVSLWGSFPSGDRGEPPAPSGAPHPAGHLPPSAGLPHPTPRPSPRHVPFPGHVPGRHRTAHSPRGEPRLPGPSGRLGSLWGRRRSGPAPGPAAAEAAASGKVGRSEGGRVGGAEGRGSGVAAGGRAGREPGVAKEQGEGVRKRERGPGKRAG